MKSYAILLTLLAVCLFGIYGIQSVEGDSVGRAKSNDLKFTYFYKLSGTSPYIRYVNKSEGKVYDLTNDTLSDSATWTDTDIALEDKMAVIGGWQIPDDKLPPAGTYDLLLYDVDTAEGSRANTDEVARGKHVIVDGSTVRIITLSDI
jgi:hypothetical protein